MEKYEVSLGGLNKYKEMRRAGREKLNNFRADAGGNYPSSWT